jgi:protease PrsW
MKSGECSEAQVAPDLCKRLDPGVSPRELTLVATSNPIYVPSILLGAFLVPVTFVAYLYERLPSWDVPLQTLAVCFLWGGVLGTVVAGALEYEVARH